MQDFKYFFITPCLISEPVLPFCPAVTATNSEDAVKGFLPFGGWRRHGACMPSIRVAKVLKGSAIGGVMVPYSKLEQGSSQS